MKHILAVLTLFTGNAFAQSAEDSVKQTINRLFEGMRKNDTALIRTAFAPGAMLQTIGGRPADLRIMNQPLDSFLHAVSRPHTEVYDERIRFDMIRIDGPLATAWTPYQFFIGEKFSHCGVNSFQLVRLKGEWKVQYLIDTRRRTGCL